jgi:hypothetical protein
MQRRKLSQQIVSEDHFAVKVTIFLVGDIEDLNLQKIAPRRAHQGTGRALFRTRPVDNETDPGNAYLLNFRLALNSPMRPMPSSTMVAGSGTAAR